MALIDDEYWGRGHVFRVPKKESGRPLRYYRAQIPVKDLNGEPLYKEDGTRYKDVIATHKSSRSRAIDRATAKLHRIYQDHGIEPANPVVDTQSEAERERKRERRKNDKRLWTVEKYANYWRAHHLNDEEHTLNTQAKFRRNFTNHLVPILGHIRMSELSIDDIDYFCDVLKKKRDPRSKEVFKVSTRHHILKQVRQMLDTAVEEHAVLRTNPVLKRHIPSVAKGRPEFKGRLGGPSVKNVIRRVLEKVKEEQDHTTYLNLLLMLWGLRQGERSGLAFDRIVNLKQPGNAYIQITRQFLNEDGHGHRVVDRTKTTKSLREFYAGETLRQALVKQKELQHEWKSTELWQPPEITADYDLVLTTPTGKPFFQQYANAEWNALREAYIPDELLKKWGFPKFNEHVMRHMTASFLLDQKIDIHTAAKMMGHSVEMIEYYAETDKEQSKDAVLQHDEFLSLVDADSGTRVRTLKESYDKAS